MNPKKEPGRACRNGAIGVAFPPDRLAEVKAAADAKGLTVSAWARMLILNELDAVHYQQEKRNKILGKNRTLPGEAPTVVAGVRMLVVSDSGELRRLQECADWGADAVQLHEQSTAAQVEDKGV